MSIAERLAAEVAILAAGQARLVIAVDGPDAAGKTTLAMDVADRLPVPVIAIGVDRFHRPRADRYRRGELSAEGYYRDSFDNEVISGQCLAPFRAGAPMIRTAGFDFRTDNARADEAVVPTAAVLIFDGVFLLRPELAGFWDLAIYLRVSPETTLRRALTRDLDLFGSPDEIRRRYRGRYLPGQALYRAEAAPEDRAHIVIGNDDPSRPVVIAWRPPARTVRRDTGRPGSPAPG